MNSVKKELQSRAKDILSYLRILRHVEQSAGPTQLTSGSSKPMRLTARNIFVLKAGVFLHLYNLVEATVTLALEQLTSEIEGNQLSYGDLNDVWRRAWVTHKAKIDKNLSNENQLKRAMELCEHVASKRHIVVKPKRGSGNLDDREIEMLATRYGIPLRLPQATVKSIKTQVLNDLGFLGLVRKTRNDLAHGEQSFADIGQKYSTADLCKWAWGTYRYLVDLLQCLNLYASAGLYRK